MNRSREPGAGRGGSDAVAHRDGDQGEEAPTVGVLGRAEQLGRDQAPGHAVSVGGGRRDVVRGSHVG